MIDSFSSAFALIPAPRRFTELPGIVARPGTFVISGANEQVQKQIKELLRDATGVAFSNDEHAGSATLLLDLDGRADILDGTEAYRLKVSGDGITLTARTYDGLTHAAATLTQLLDNTAPGTDIPSCEIEDAPEYAWRGLSVDVARSFYTVEEIQQVLDMMWLYKFNILHLHLTDDQGWRIEIDGRDNLTSISGQTSGEGGRSGFYTKADYAALQDYAEDRGITVVPEVDIPGHTNAATHAYGELNPSGAPTDAYSGMQVGFSMLHPELEATEPFLRDVISSLAAQTRGPYLHFGGDEALDMDLDNYKELVQLTEALVKEYGKKPVAWQEAASADLPPDTLYQFWDPRLEKDDLSRAAAAGAKVIMSPATTTYFDMQYDPQTPYGQDWAGLIELDQAYNWDPAKQIPGVGADDIVGIEATIWTEKIQSFDALSYQLLPRLAATAELAWCGVQRADWDTFRGRIGRHGHYWTTRGWSWHRSPMVEWVEAD